MTDEQREARLKRDAEKFRENLAVPRPGMGVLRTEELPVLAKHGVDLSDILYVPVSTLKPNHLNEYPPLAASEMDELVRDVREKGILVPLITKTDGTIVCGHNRHTAALRAELERVPVQQILSPLSAALEKDIMKSENDRRRGGRWTRQEKEKFIAEHFTAALNEDRRGGDFGNQHTGGKSSMNFSRNGGGLAKEIEKKSRGRIAEGTAKRLIAGMRKTKQPDSGKTRLSDQDRRRGEKLAARLGEIRKVVTLLEEKLVKAKAEEKVVLKELKTIGQPELFGVLI